MNNSFFCVWGGVLSKQSQGMYKRVLLLRSIVLIWWFAFKDLLQTSQHDQSNKTFHPVEILLSLLLAASLMESTENQAGGRGARVCVAQVLLHALRCEATAVAKKYIRNSWAAFNKGSLMKTTTQGWMVQSEKTKVMHQLFLSDVCGVS